LAFIPITADQIVLCINPFQPTFPEKAWHNTLNFIPANDPLAVLYADSLKFSSETGIEYA
jgi:hypothetical protein